MPVESVPESRSDSAAEARRANRRQEVAEKRQRVEEDQSSRDEDRRRAEAKGNRVDTAA